MHSVLIAEHFFCESPSKGTKTDEILRSEDIKSQRRQRNLQPKIIGMKQTN